MLEVLLPAPLKKAMAEQAKARKQSTAAVYLMVPGLSTEGFWSIRKEIEVNTLYQFLIRFLKRRSGLVSMRR